MAINSRRTLPCLTAPFWIRLYNLSLGCRSINHISLIARSVGDVIEVEKDGVGWDISARVRVMMDVTKPLRRVQQISWRNGSVLVEIKYKRLPTFCYVCGHGIIGHIERDCMVIGDDDNIKNKQWGSWLRASSKRGRQNLEEEMKAFLGCARAIRFESSQKEDEMGRKAVMAPEASVSRDEGVVPTPAVVSEMSSKEVAVVSPLCINKTPIIHVSQDFHLVIVPQCNPDDNKSSDNKICNLGKHVHAELEDVSSLHGLHEGGGT